MVRPCQSVLDYCLAIFRTDLTIEFLELCIQDTPGSPKFYLNVTCYHDSVVVIVYVPITQIPVRTMDQLERDSASFQQSQV